MVDWVAVLSGVSTSLQIAKDLRALDKSFDEAVVRAQLVNLMEQLSDVRVQVLDAKEEAAAKDALIAELRSDLDFRQTKLVDKGRFRYFADENGEAKGNPICPVCEKKGIYHAVVQDRSKGAGGVTYYCPGCKANYGPRVPRM